jgi:hypothetical protein
MDSRDFGYQACLAYYIHRCLPESPGPGLAALQLEIKNSVRHITVYIAYLLLWVVSLQIRRYRGVPGTGAKNPKPAFKYRGMVEGYLAYIFWIISTNDTATGADAERDRISCSIDYSQFHRYFFTEMVDTIVLADPRYAYATEFCDILFFAGPDIISYGGLAQAALGPTGGQDTPDNIINFAVRRIMQFYRRTFKPLFSRHFSGLRPDPTGDEILLNQQILVYNMLLTVEDVITVYHLVEKATIGDIDTFVGSVGNHGVFRCWTRLLAACPKRTTDLLNDFTDALTMCEYRNIMDFMRSDPEQPRMPEATAECIYMLCNTLNIPSEPNTEEELELLRQSPKCSALKAAVRLQQVGAFRLDESVLNVT